MKKFLSFLFLMLIIAGLVAVNFMFPGFYEQQINKVQGMYFVYKGDKAYSKHKLQKAIDFYKRGLVLYPNHYGAWYNLGNIYVVYEDYYSATEAYEEAIKYNPKFVAARMNYGIVSTERLGDFDGAISQYKTILNTKRNLLSIPFIYNNRRSTKANNGLAYYNMGVAYKQKSFYSGDDMEFKRRYLTNALDSYKKAVKIIKKDYDAQYNLALTYHLLGNYHDAGMTYCKAISISPMNYEAHYNLAILLKHLKYYKESLDEMTKATSLITNSEGMSNRQRYIFDVMNDMTRVVAENSLMEDLDGKGTKWLVAPENSGLTYVNGKLVASDDLDKAMIRNFKTCGSRSIFKEDIDRDYIDPNEGRSRIRLPLTD